MKFRSVLVAVAATLISINSVFAQNNTKEMLRVIPQNAIAAGYVNSAKFMSGSFMRELSAIMKSNPKNNVGEVIFGISTSVDQKGRCFSRAVLCGMAKSDNLESQWDANVQDLKKQKKISIRQGKLEGKDYVSLRAADNRWEMSGYVLKVDQKTASFKLFVSDSEKEFAKPENPFFYPQTAPLVRKLDTAACVSFALDTEAVRNIVKATSDTATNPIPKELEGLHTVVVSFTEKEPFLQFSAQIYADEATLVSIQNTINEMPQKTKKDQDSLIVFLSKVKVIKNADHLSILLSVPSKPVLYIIEAAHSLPIPKLKKKSIQ